jgi:hypothetical protein
LSTQHAAPPPARGAAAAAIAATAALAAAAAAAALGAPFMLLVAAIGLLALSRLTIVPTIPWRALLGALVVVIVFIPIKRYSFETGLPFQLEPYRVLVALLLGGWAACLLVDKRFRLRRTGLEAPIAVIAIAAVGSVLANTTRVAELQSEVLKSLSYLASFFLVFFLVATVTRRSADVQALLKTLVSAMAVVGVLAVIESRTGMSPFGYLEKVLPVIEQTEPEIDRAGVQRARGPAEHPIALSAALVLIVPVAFYLASTAKKRRLWWWIALAATSMGVLATLSRTGILMVGVVGLVYLIFRRRETARFWPLLLPFLAAVHFAMPGTLGTIKASFFPEGGLIAEQENESYSCISSGRIADIGPTLDQVSGQPFFGIGYGTRIVTGLNPNACILDDQWLATLLETGIVGALGWLWFFARFIRRLGGVAVRRSAEGDLCVALVAAAAAYAVGMFTYDAHSFVQVTFVVFLLMGIGASVLLRTRPRVEEAPAAA